MLKKDLILYAVLLGVLMFLFRWFEFGFYYLAHAQDFFIGGIALFFLILGIWFAKQFIQPKTKIIEKEVIVERIQNHVNPLAIESSGLTQRELEVLQLMAKGLSNNEIADQLHLSLHTIKSHSSKLFDKLQVKRRTQAVEVAKSLNIIK
jgi:two-component system, NarL family, response regulator LiaR